MHWLQLVWRYSPYVSLFPGFLNAIGFIWLLPTLQVPGQGGGGDGPLFFISLQRIHKIPPRTSIIKSHKPTSIAYYENHPTLLATPLDPRSREDRGGTARPVPLDVINKKPMGYRTIANGKYALWSVGFDDNADNGKRGNLTQK